MPYEFPKNIPTWAKNLPKGAQKIAVRTMNAVLKAGLSEDEARRAAWNNIKRLYQRLAPGVWKRRRKKGLAPATERLKTFLSEHGAQDYLFLITEEEKILPKGSVVYFSFTGDDWRKYELLRDLKVRERPAKMIKPLKKVLRRFVILDFAKLKSLEDDKDFIIPYKQEVFVESLAILKEAYNQYFLNPLWFSLTKDDKELLDKVAYLKDKAARPEEEKAEPVFLTFTTSSATFKKRIFDDLKEAGLFEYTDRIIEAKRGAIPRKTLTHPHRYTKGLYGFFPFIVVLETGEILFWCYYSVYFRQTSEPRAETFALVEKPEYDPSTKKINRAASLFFIQTKGLPKKPTTTKELASIPEVKEAIEELEKAGSQDISAELSPGQEIFFGDALAAFKQDKALYPLRDLKLAFKAPTTQQVFEGGFFAVLEKLLKWLGIKRSHILSFIKLKDPWTSHVLRSLAAGKSSLGVLKEPPLSFRLVLRGKEGSPLVILRFSKFPAGRAVQDEFDQALGRALPERETTFKTFIQRLRAKQVPPGVRQFQREEELRQARREVYGALPPSKEQEGPKAVLHPGGEIGFKGLFKIPEEKREDKAAEEPELLSRAKFFNLLNPRTQKLDYYLWAELLVPHKGSRRYVEPFDPKFKFQLGLSRGAGTFDDLKADLQEFVLG